MTRPTNVDAAAIFERSQEILDDQPWLSQDQAKDAARRELGVLS
ncbi:hypothetical protein EDF18_0949 [Frigoribacterium sp. PhB107]|nr:hypothetical protein [Frigoribacterium sp. PhB107]ROP78303.1 hypothetical protein EDF18_0949 [Frigoribacterium sp. PhB107]